MPAADFPRTKEALGKAEEAIASVGMGSVQNRPAFALGVLHELASSLLTSSTHYSQVAAWYHENLSGKDGLHLVE